MGKRSFEGAPFLPGIEPEDSKSAAPKPLPEERVSEKKGPVSETSFNTSAIDEENVEHCQFCGDAVDAECHHCDRGRALIAKHQLERLNRRKSR